MKNFDENLTEQFTDFKVGKPEFAAHLEHLYADYIELVALFANKCFVTASDILDRLKDEGAIRKKEETNVAAEENDKNEAWINELFSILELRATLFGDDYPFAFSPNKIILKERLSSKNELYIFLLISSNLDLFNKVKSSLTDDFEMVSYLVLKNFLPPQAIVKQFGTNSDYKGTAITKIRALAADLKVEVREYELDNISERNNKERGLDVIGWIPFSDKCPNLITILGQCACGKKWYDKHHDTSRYKRYLKFFRLNPYSAMFIPYALIGKDNGTKFFRSDDIEESTLVFERKRLIEYYNNSTDFNLLESKQIVDQCIRYVEDIV